jgi:hypothetical protein
MGIFENYDNFFRRHEALLQLKEAERNSNLIKIQNLKDERLQRSSSLQRSTEIFTAIQSKFNNVMLTEKNVANWESLFERDRIRDGSKSPQSARDLMAILEIESQKFEDENVNWWLECDELSLLTQVAIPDTRRSVMRENLIARKEQFFKNKMMTLLMINDRLADIIKDEMDVMETKSANLQEISQVREISFETKN